MATYQPPSASRPVPQKPTLPQCERTEFLAHPKPECFDTWQQPSVKTSIRPPRSGRMARCSKPLSGLPRETPRLRARVTQMTGASQKPWSGHAPLPTAKSPAPWRRESIHLQRRGGFIRHPSCSGSHKEKDSQNWNVQEPAAFSATTQASLSQSLAQNLAKNFYAKALNVSKIQASLDSQNGPCIFQMKGTTLPRSRSWGRNPERGRHADARLVSMSNVHPHSQ